MAGTSFQFPAPTFHRTALYFTCDENTFLRFGPPYLSFSTFSPSNFYHIVFYFIRKPTLASSPSYPTFRKRLPFFRLPVTFFPLGFRVTAQKNCGDALRRRTNSSPLCLSGRVGRFLSTANSRTLRFGNSHDTYSRQSAEATAGSWRAFLATLTAAAAVLPVAAGAEHHDVRLGELHQPYPLGAAASISRAMARSASALERAGAGEAGGLGRRAVGCRVQNPRSATPALWTGARLPCAAGRRRLLFLT